MPTPARFACVTALTLAGCAGSAGPSADLGAAARLERLAAREAGSTRTPIPAPLPPGVDPVVLAARGDEPRTRMTFAEAMADLDRVRPGPTEAAAPPASPQDADQALRHYASGRDAALRGRHLAAVAEFEKAAKLDPSSAAVLRQLARSYLAMHNALKAASRYEKLLAMEPEDSEALFTTGLLAANRRQFDRAAALLGRPHLRGGAFDHDPAARYLADYRLASSLWELGYDRAAIEIAGPLLEELPHRLARPSFHAEGLASIYRRRADIRRAIGDSYCRLEKYERALEAYRESAVQPSADPDALHARVIYANLRLGRQWSAQAELLEALGDGSMRVSEQDIRLCSYVAGQVGDLHLLAEAVIERQSARPEDPEMARAAATLLPRDEALQLLRGFVERRPDDISVLAQLLGWLAERDVRAAVGLTVALAADRPARAAEYGDALARVARSPSAALEAAQTLAPSPARAVVQSRLLVSVGALGNAWWVLGEALEQWPMDPGVHMQRIDVAARLDEPRLLDEAVAASAPLDGAAVWLARAQARAALGQSGTAVLDAASAVERAGRDAETVAALAAAHAVHAEQLRSPDDRRNHAESAAAAARRALELDPACEPAYAVLLSLRAPEGPLNDAEAYVELREQVAAHVPDGPLAARLEAQRDLGQGRIDGALERLLTSCATNPGDTESLALAVHIWTRTERLDAARRWVEARLRERPADSALLRHLVQVLLRLDEPGAAVERLRRLLDNEPAHDTARELLAEVYEHDGQEALVVPLAEKRLLSRPQGVRREVELAAAYAAASMDEAAAARLRWVLDHADEASYEHLVTALSMAGRLSDEHEQYNPLVIELADRAVARHPDAPLRVYGTGLRALARAGRLDESFDDLADRAVRYAQGASGPSVQVADVWRQLAQALVDSGHPAAAARVARARLLAEAPLDPAARTLLTWVAISADAAVGDVSATISLVERLALRGMLPAVPAVDEEPTIADVFYDASIIYSMLGDDEGATRLLGEVIEQVPDHAMALNNFGYTRIEMGYGDQETVHAIARAHELQPADANILDTVGWLRYKQGEFGGDGRGGALSLIQAAIAAGDTSAEVLDHLGDTLWRLGDEQGAVRAWRQVVSILEDPGHRDGREQDYLRAQARWWWLVVADPREMYDREFGPLLEGARSKLRAADEGSRPPLAATFEESGDPQHSGDGDGGP